MNVIAQLKFKLTYSDITVKHVSYFDPETFTKKMVENTNIVKNIKDWIRWFQK